MNASATPQELTACEHSPRDLSNEFLRSWERLDQASVEPNPFLHPHFVLAQIEHLPEESPLSLWTVRDAEGELVLLTVLRPVAASSQILFPHLNDKTSTYKFQGGMLLDRQVARGAMTTFLQYLKTTRYRHGMVLDSMCIDASFSEQLYTSAALTGFQVQLHGTWSRASLNFQELDRANLFDSCLSKSRRKSMRRAFTKLQRHGAVRFRVIESRNEVPSAVERFLDLEQRGWKRETGTAIRCVPNHQAFFETFINHMAADGRVLFGELLSGDHVVASTCNLVSGNTLFAFKIGWDPELRDGSPGAWAEIELANYVAREKPEIALLNSCSSAGSYLDRLWPHRLAMGNVILSQSHRAVLYSSVRKTLRSAKRLLWPVSEE